MKRLSVIFLIIVIFLSVGVASAHRLVIVHRIGEVEIEAYFGGGYACRDANVSVYTITENVEELYTEGITDGAGKFTFSPKVGVYEYKVVVDSVHMPGHRSEEIINIKAIDSESAEGGNEMSTYSMALSGLGYIAGLAGFAIWYKGLKAQKNQGNR